MTKTKMYHVVEYQRLYAEADAIVEATSKAEAIQKFRDGDFNEAWSSTTAPDITASRIVARLEPYSCRKKDTQPRDTSGAEE